jgi:hypothetical protein
VEDAQFRISPDSKITLNWISFGNSGNRMETKSFGPEEKDIIFKANPYGSTTPRQSLFSIFKNYEIEEILKKFDCSFSFKLILIPENDIEFVENRDFSDIKNYNFGKIEYVHSEYW